MPSEADECLRIAGGGGGRADAVVNAYCGRISSRGGRGGGLSNHGDARRRDKKKRKRKPHSDRN